MKVKIQAGAEIDVLSRQELVAELAAAGASWRTEQAKGVTWRTASMWGTVTAGGTLTLGESGDQVIGPEQGMLWGCQRISVSDGYTPASQVLRLHRNNTDLSTLIVPDLSGYDQLYGEILRGGDRLVVTGASLTAAAIVWVTVLAREVPEYLIGRL